MTNSKYISYLLIVFTLLIVVAASYALISYVGTVLSGFVDFFAAGNVDKLKQCGITPPQSFYSFKNDVTTFVLPFIYVGFPLFLVIISAIMFVAGMMYKEGKHEDQGSRL